MEQLNEQNLWDRITTLVGATVYTIDLRIPNVIEQVTEDEVYLVKQANQRPTSPEREHFWAVYEYLWQHGQVTQQDFESDRLSHVKRHWVSRIVLAILAEAIPEQIVAFRRGPGVMQSGIRLRDI